MRFASWLISRKLSCLSPKRSAGRSPWRAACSSNIWCMHFALGYDAPVRLNSSTTRWRSEAGVIGSAPSSEDGSAQAALAKRENDSANRSTSSRSNWDASKSRAADEELELTDERNSRLQPGAGK